MKMKTQRVQGRLGEGTNSTSHPLVHGIPNSCVHKNARENTDGKPRVQRGRIVGDLLRDRTEKCPHPRVIDYFLSLWKGNALSSSLLPEQVGNMSPGRKSKAPGDPQLQIHPPSMEQALSTPQSPRESTGMQHGWM